MSRRSARQDEFPEQNVEHVTDRHQQSVRNGSMNATCPSQVCPAEVAADPRLRDHDTPTVTEPEMGNIVLTAGWDEV